MPEQTETPAPAAAHPGPCGRRHQGELRERYAAAILWARDGESVGPYTATDAVLAVRDRELEQLRAQVVRVRELAERWKYTGDRKHGPLRELLDALADQLPTA